MPIISVIQFKPRLAFTAADVKDNLRKIDSIMVSAYDSGSELVVLPELCTTGYTYLNQEEAALVAEPRDGSTFRYMANHAKSLEGYVAYGFVEVLDGRLYNSCNVVSPNGELVSNYQKMNLWGNDFLWANPGRSIPSVVDTSIGKIAALVCRDIKGKSPSNTPDESLSKTFFDREKPDIVALCSNWGKGGFPPNSWMDYSVKHNCIVAAANTFGTEEKNGFTNDFGCGGSVIVEPSWKIHSNGLKFNEPCIVTAMI